MQLTENARGFQRLMASVYPPPHPHEDAGKPTTDMLVAQSSMIGDYPDSFEKPGSSYLWFSDNHHLNREEVAELVKHLQNWLDTGRL